MHWKHRRMLKTKLSYCEIRNGKLVINGIESYVSDSANNTFFKELYDFSGMNYPKFFKMDSQSKLALLTSVFLLENIDKTQYFPEEWSVLLSCRNGSSDSDLKYWESVQTVPSPALFVYTLPNVMIGELCILHGFKGETNCFVFDEPDIAFMQQQAEVLLQNGSSAVIFGWVNFFAENYEASLFLTEKSDYTN